jgi:hypothetical protein
MGGAINLRNEPGGAPHGCVFTTPYNEGEDNQVFYNLANSSFTCDTPDIYELRNCVCGAKLKGKSQEQQATCLEQERSLNLSRNPDFSQNNIKFCVNSNCSTPNDPEKGDRCTFYGKNDKEISVGVYALTTNTLWNCGKVGYAECEKPADPVEYSNVKLCVNPDCSADGDPQDGAACTFYDVDDEERHFFEGGYAIYKQVLTHSGSKIGIAVCRQMR